MINQTPSDLGKFPVPPSGHPIPRGWFGRLVRFINSLILHGDNQYLTIKHTMDGQTITLTPAVINALSRASGGPSAPGVANQDISASVTGGTATVALSGSTSAVNFVGTGSVSISGNTNTGNIEINSSAGISPYPVWGSLYRTTLLMTWTENSGDYILDPITLDHSGYLYIEYDLTTDPTDYSDSDLSIEVDGEQIFLSGIRNASYSGTDYRTQLIPVHSGSTVTASFYSLPTPSAPSLSLSLFHT